MLIHQRLKSQKWQRFAEGTIFKHYGTKDHLLLSVILYFIKRISLL